MERNMPHSWEERGRKLKWMKRIEGPVGLGKAKRDFPRPKARDSRSGSRRQPRGRQLTSLPQIKGYILPIATDGHRLKYSRGFGKATFYGGSRRSYCAPDFEESWVMFGFCVKHLSKMQLKRRILPIPPVTPSPSVSELEPQKTLFLFYTHCEFISRWLYICSRNTNIHFLLSQEKAQKKLKWQNN